jgi:hypothetical protein
MNKAASIEQIQYEQTVAYLTVPLPLQADSMSRNTRLT